MKTSINSGLQAQPTGISGHESSRTSLCVVLSVYVKYLGQGVAGLTPPAQAWIDYGLKFWRDLRCMRPRCCLVCAWLNPTVRIT